jgi:hypothetical protein
MVSLFYCIRRHASQHQRAADLLSDGAKQFHLLTRVLMGQPVLDIDDPDHPVARNDWSREKRLETVFRQVSYRLEPGIPVSLTRDGQEPPFTGYPPCQAFMQSQTDLADRSLVESVRSAQYQFVVIQEVNQAAVALGELNDQRDDSLKHFLQAHLAHHEPANLLKKTELLFGALEPLIEIPDLRHYLIITAALQPAPRADKIP